jgi:[protein-PII] uridylyltransferase
MKCTTCGAEQAVHGDCLVCNSPLAAPRGYSAAVAVAEEATSAPSVVAALVDRFPPDVIEEHLRQLPASYLRRTHPEAIGDHIALIMRADGGTAVEHSKVGDVDRITVATSDRPGILAALAGALAANGVNIIGGSAHTRDDGVALDVMFVSPSETHPEDGWQVVCTDVAQALAGEYDFDKRLAAVREQIPTRISTIPTTVYVDTDLSGTFTRIEVNTIDRVGLLYAITKALQGLSLDIHLAMVETEGLLGVDTFYVQRADGSRLDGSEAAHKVQTTLKEAIAALG